MILTSVLSFTKDKNQPIINLKDHKTRSLRKFVNYATLNLAEAVNLLVVPFFGIALSVKTVCDAAFCVITFRFHLLKGCIKNILRNIIITTLASISFSIGAIPIVGQVFAKYINENTFDKPSTMLYNKEPIKPSASRASQFTYEVLHTPTKIILIPSFITVFLTEGSFACLTFNKKRLYQEFKELKNVSYLFWSIFAAPYKALTKPSDYEATEFHL